MEEPVQIGIVGLGRAGMIMHAKEMLERPQYFEIVAGADPVDSRTDELSAMCRATGYHSLDALLEDDRVEVVTIANRSTDHYDTARKVLDAGKIALVEKPMTTRYEHAADLVRRDQELGGGRLFVRQNRRFDPDFVTVSRLITSGLLGPVYKIRLNRHSYQRRNDWQVVREFGGGQLLNWGPHLIDHALQLLGNDADLVWCDLRRIAAAGDAEDHVHLILESKRTRAVAEIEISGGVAIGSPLYQVYGSTGGLEADAEGARLRYLNPDQPLPQAVVDLSPPKGFYNEELPWVEREEAITPEGITTIWDALYNTVRHGTEFPISSEDALAVMRVIHEAKKGSEFAE